MRAATRTKNDDGDEKDDNDKREDENADKEEISRIIGEGAGKESRE